MNCLYSEEIRAQNLQNKKLERKLQIYKRRYNKQIKLLLLGASGSGKSTFIRQIRYIYDRGQAECDNRMKYVGIIHQNIFLAMQIMIEAMQILQIPYETEENEANSVRIRNVDLEYPVLFVNAYFLALKELWEDAGIQKCYLRGREYAQLDSTKYFFNHLDRIASPEYIPSDQDILRARIPTNGFREHSIKYKNVEFLITDVGLQRSERKKWIHCFDNVTAIIFMVAISEYDQFTFDSRQCNRLKESQELLRTTASYEFLENIALILVFNKVDIFEEKIMSSHLADYFSEFKGPQCDPRAARNFISNIFLSVIPTKRRNYHYFLSSTDKYSGSFVFIYTAVRDTILNSNLYNFNLV